MKELNLKIIAAIAVLFGLACLSSCKEDDMPSGEKTTIAVSESALEFSAEGGSTEFEILSNGEWEMSSDAQWLTLSDTSGEGDKAITVTAQASGDTTARSAVITVTTADASLEIQVSQQGAEISDMTSVQLANAMGIGWNLGNSLEATGGETAWGNPKVSQRLIDSVKAAGFNAVRIPVAWSKFSNEETFTIQESWMNRVEEVVNYVLDNDMYAIVNIHWDGGWMQPTYEEEEYVNTRLAAMWEQIATHFRDYDEHLLFAGTNEVMVEGDYGTPTEEYYTVQNGFNQTFVSTVRATGGRNLHRFLVVQGFNTNIDHTVNFAVIPEDTVENRLLMEVHYYDPYNFTLNQNSDITQWGEIAEDPQKTETWANEAYADAQFAKMKTNFVDEGYGVIVGEYGVISRDNVEDHDVYREYYIDYVTEAMLANGLVPFYWDNGYSGNYGFALFDRNTGAQLEPELIDAIIESE